MMNYIIFGGTGFIGTHLAKAIVRLHENEHKDFKVWNLDVANPERIQEVLDNKVASWATVKKYKTALCEGEKHQATWVECDVRKPIDSDSLPFSPTSEDIIFNFAAIHRTPGHPDRDYFETNIRGAENVCAFAERYGIKKIVFTSSIAPYGAAEELKEETTLPTPNTPYGISKLVAEKVHQAWSLNPLPTLHDESGSDCSDNEKKLLIVRPGVVFGRGENGNFTRLYRGIRKHTFAYPGRKDTIKACVYVKELVNFMLWYSLTPNPFPNGEGSSYSNAEIFNCTFEPAYTIEQIVTAMKKITGLKQAVPYIPNAVIMPAAACAMLLGSPMGICPARVKKLQISTNICGRKLAMCGYKFRYTFEEALVDWFNDCKRECLE